MRRVWRIVKHVAGREASAILSHGPDAPCCQAAKAWFGSVGSYAPRDEPPRWIAERWKWGPSSWPLYWCEVPSLERLDCGALAALAREWFAFVEAHAFGAQLIQRFDASAGDHWRAMWGGAGKEWVWREFVYHEIVGYVVGSDLRWWDPSDGRWVDLDAGGEYDTIVAVRALAETAHVERRTFTWLSRERAFNVWHVRGSERVGGTLLDSAAKRKRASVSGTSQGPRRDEGRATA